MAHSINDEFNKYLTGWVFTSWSAQLVVLVKETEQSFNASFKYGHLFDIHSRTPVGYLVVSKDRR